MMHRVGTNNCQTKKMEKGDVFTIDVSFDGSKTMLDFKRTLFYNILPVY